MPPTVGVGVVGLGWMGRLHAEAYARMPYHFPEAPRPRFVIAADSDPDKRRLAEGLGFEQTAADWDAVSAHPDVDVISISTPNHLHRLVARGAAAHGKHIWIEKPVGRTAAETVDIAEAVIDAGVKSMVGLDLRFVPVLQRARAQIASGALGELTAVRGSFLGDFGCDESAPRTWRYTREEAGYGVLGDLMMHLVDLLCFVLGVGVTEVCGTAATVISTRPDPSKPGRSAPVENEDRVASLVRFDNDLCGLAEASRVSAGRQSDVTIEVEGTDGALSWNFARMNELRVFPGTLTGGGRGSVTVLADPSHGAYGAFQPGPGLPMGYDDLKVIQAAALCDAVVSGRPCAPDVSDALRVALVLAAMERSHQNKRWEPVGFSGSGSSGSLATCSTAASRTYAHRGRVLE